MPLKSQEFKQEIYPSFFNDDDKYLFDKLYEESKIYHPKEHKSDPWLIKYAIICYINGVNGRGEDINQEEVEKLKKEYELKSRVFETPESDEYKDPEKFLINLPDDELKDKLNIMTSNIDKNDDITNNELNTHK